ncbi:MAG: NAD(+) diphosphatase [Thermomicrobiales bacterium]
MPDHFVPAVTPPERAGDESAFWFAFRGSDLLLHADEIAGAERRIPFVPDIAQLFTPVRSHFLGHLTGRPAFAVELPDDAPAPDGMRFTGLRAVHCLVGQRLFELAGRASQIIEWDRTHQFCGRCGERMEPVATERAKRCPRCGLTSFPRLSPAVIVLVERGDEVLLARGAQFTDGMYALVAGFVEPGESLEETVRREIREEVGIAVDRIAYFDSQPWPFPHSVMIGFTAQHAGGEIAIDGAEIADARWFRPDALPHVPMKLSIARRIIDAYAAKHGVTIDQP